MNNKIEAKDGLSSLMLTQHPLTHTEMAKHVETIKDLVDRGVLNPLDAFTKLTYMMKLAEAAKDSIKQLTIEEVGKYDKREEVKANGATVQVTGKGKYDYTACEDPQWNTLRAEIDKLEKQKKSREEFLKTIKKPMGICDEDTGGETITINPPLKTTDDILRVTFPYGI